MRAVGCFDSSQMEEEEGGWFQWKKEGVLGSWVLWISLLSLRQQKAKEGGDCWGFYQLLKNDACWILKILHRREQQLAAAKDDGGDAQSMPSEILLRRERGRAELELR